MKYKWLVGLVLLAVPISCRAGFLHQSMQGTYNSNGNDYSVANDGTITVNAGITQSQIISGSACGSYVVYNGMQLKSVEELDNVIKDLQHVSKEIHDADTNCKSSCK